MKLVSIYFTAQAIFLQNSSQKTEKCQKKQALLLKKKPKVHFMTTKGTLSFVNKNSIQ